jgi:CBS domain-containing protein
MEQTVRDVMHAGVITCPINITLGELTRLLVDKHVHAVFIEDDRGSIAGVISDIDLLTGEWLFTDEASLRVLKSVTAGELMSSPAASVETNVPLQQVAARMAEQHLHRLLVTDAGKPVGVISVSDIVRSLGHQDVIQRTVKEVMSQAIVVCLLDTPLAAVARGMSERRSRSVIVVESSGASKGIITGLDLMRFVGDNGFEQKMASDVMRAPITIFPEASLRDAADAMISHRIHRLVVIDSNQPETMPIGLISTSDIMIEMAQPGSTW